MNLSRSVWFVTLGALFLIPFLPLIVTNSLFFPFITGKAFAFRILVEIAAAGWVLLALGDTKYRPRFSWTLVLHGALVVWMAVADALAVNPHKAFWSNYERMDGWVTLAHLFVFFIVAGSVLTADKLWRKWWLTFLGVASIVSFYALFQAMGWFQIHQGGVRVDATLGNAAYLAAYLLFAIAISCWQAIESKGMLRYSLYGLIGLEVIILFLTATRGAILGAVGAAVLAALLWMFEAGKRERKIAAVILGIFILLVGGFLSIRSSAWVQQEPTLARLASISLAEGQTRFTIWRMALEGAKDRPVTGWGHEGFNYVFNTYYEPSMYNQEPWFDRAHNTFLDWLIAGGFPALLLFLALLASAVVALYRGTASRGERVMLIAAFAAYAFQGLFVFDNLLTYVPLAALFALAHAASARPIDRLMRLPTPDVSTLGSIALPVVGIVGAVLIYMVNVPSVLAGQRLIHALSPQSDLSVNLSLFQETLAGGSFGLQEIREQLITYAASVAGQQTIPQETRSAFTALAVSEMNKELMRAPKDARLYLQLSNAYRAMGDLTDAIQAIETARVLSPKKQQIYIQEGIAYWQSGNSQKAYELFNTAYELDPSFDDVAVYAAAGKFIAGDPKAGQTILQNHFGTTTVDSDVLMYAYYEAKRYDDLVTFWEVRAAKEASANNNYQLAAAYAVSGRNFEARALVLATIKKYPETAITGNAFLKQLP
ncbi:MAG: O-antigen ligase family protein [Minisyncoccia bacterium]